ncbi:hypothetical protein AWN76_013825 [Rhodothermaceae bacterium RA]|nr:hypothetical protein AWN76_013825 [Rhodothermaceae bacterium RA]
MMYPRYLLLLPVLLLVGCDTGPADSLYDPDRTLQPDPVVSSLDPPERALAGVDEVTISGANFSATPSDNLVYFGALRAELLAASPTELVVRAPNLPFEPTLSRSQETYALKVAVIGAELFSEPRAYTLEAVAVDFADIKDFEEAFAITSDDEGNLYVSLFANNASAGIKRIAPTGERSDYIASTFKWDGLAFDAAGQLYGVRNVRAVFRFPAGGGAQETWAVISDRSVRLTAITVDEAGNVWAGGPNAHLYRITPEASISEFPFEATVRALAAFGGHLYAAAEVDGTSAIYRFPMTADGLGAPETFFAFEDAFGATALALAFTAEGDLIVGSDAADPLVLITPAGDGAPLFPGVLRPTAGALAWGAGTRLYVRQDGASSEILVVNTLREGA